MNDSEDPTTTAEIEPAPATPAAPPEAPPAAAPAPAVRDKQPYPLPAPLPTQAGPLGIRFDFNLGARVAIPDGKPWRIRLWDRQTGNLLFESQAGAAYVNSTKRYFLRFGVEVFAGDEVVFAHDYDAADQKILIQFPVGTLGDIMGWFPYAVKFQELHGCRLTCTMSELLIPLFRDAYPEIRFVTHDEVKAEEYYASYCIGLFFDDEDRVWQPCDFRLVGLHRTAGYILGVDPGEMAPKLAIPDDGPPFAEPYVCIAVQSTTQSKYWNNPAGWPEVIRWLKARGLRVICIDQKPLHGFGIVWNHIPHGAEDFTGNRPLAERARFLRHARAFIGLSSGLSWLAWAAGVPVLMISGFTHPTNEFGTDYRVINYHACNSCWNDVRHRFDHRDFLWCPRHAGTPRQFECTRLITAAQVIATLERISGVADLTIATESMTNYLR
jgi:autotransporter strand-loop-strand O-heptosyltransferase